MLLQIGGFIGLPFFLVPFVKYVKGIKKGNDFLASVVPGRKQEVERYYVNLMGQNKDPSDYNELNEEDPDTPKKELISYFIKEVFGDSKSGTLKKTKAGTGKYHMILADYGMGKTTFLIKLYKKYIGSFSITSRKRIEYIPLDRSDCMNQIKEIDIKEKCILLLDAFDENLNAIVDEKKFWEELTVATSRFYKVVITCRTHFFTSKENEPVETYISNLDIGDKTEKVNCIYISPFSDKQVNQYLYKRFWNKRQIIPKAKEIVSRIPNLTARPLILSRIEDLCAFDNTDFSYNAQVYDYIIESWISRESPQLVLNSEGKRNINYQRGILVFSLEVCKEMFLNGSAEISLSNISAIASKRDVDLMKISAQSRSLLNRNSLGIYKFAHSTFYEYLLSILWIFHHEEWMDEKEKSLSKQTIQFINENIILLMQGKRIFAAKNGTTICLRKAAITDLNVFGKSFDGSDFSYVTFRNSIFDYTNMRKAHFDNSHLGRTDFDNAVLSKASFRNSYLTDVSFYNAHLDESNFGRASLTNVDFRHADLQYADFVGATLVDINFRGANLKGANFKGSTLINFNIRDLCNAGVDISDILSWDVKLKNMDLSGYNIKYLLQNMDYYKYLNFAGARMVSMNLSKLDLSEMCFYQSNFSRANLRNVNFSHTDLREANLSGANTFNTDFRMAKINGANLSERYVIDLKQALFGYTFHNKSIPNAVFDTVYIDGKLRSKEYILDTYYSKD